MSISVFILPTSKYIGLRILTKSLEYALLQEGLKVETFHPIYDTDMSIEKIEEYLLNNRIKEYVEIFLNKFYEKSKEVNFVIVSGMFRQGDYAHKLYPLNSIVHELNNEIIKALSAKVIIASYQGNKSLDDISDDLEYSYRNLPKKAEIISYSQ